MEILTISVSLCMILLVSTTEKSGTEEEKRLLLHSDNDIAVEIQNLKREVATLTKDLDDQKNMTTTLKQEYQKNLTTALKQENQRFEAIKRDLEARANGTEVAIQQLKAFQQAHSDGSGSVYVRWGRNVCPSTASLVYKGFTAGKRHNEKGGGTNNLCLPTDPTWLKYVDDNVYTSNRAHIYGTEIDTDDNVHIFNYPVNQQDIPCVVCRSTKSTTLMIPARNNCYSGWNTEYKGYLMAAASAIFAYEHICVDENPEFLQHGGTDDNQHILYLVEGQCGSLPCPPYVNGRELACVVCSK